MHDHSDGWYNRKLLRRKMKHFWHTFATTLHLCDIIETPDMGLKQEKNITNCSKGGTDHPLFSFLR